jgi:tetratricopeptide (TPR) repeat protein
MVPLPPLLLAMGAYVDYDERRRPRDYLLAVAGFLAAMLEKSSVVMFPVVILLYAWWKRGRVSRRDWAASAIFFGVALVLGLVTVWFQQHRAIASGELALGGFLSRLANAGLALAFYAGKSVLPVGLLPVCPRWPVNPPSLVQFLPWLGLGAVLGWSWWKRMTWGRHVLLGLGFFLINLAPVLGGLKMSYLYISGVADHFVYVPLLGLIGLAVADAEALIRRSEFPRRAIVCGVAAAICALLALQSHRYAGIFRDEETLWTYTVRHNPDSWVAHHNLAGILVETGRVPQGIEHFETALRLNPSSPGSHANLGRVLIKLGRLPEGIAQEEEALRLKPDYAAAYIDLGDAFVRQGRRAEAIAAYQKALQYDARSPVAHTNLGEVLLQAGRIPEAIEQHQEALRLRPDYADGHYNLGNALVRAGRIPEAIAQYEAALRIRPDDAEAQFNLGYALAVAGRPAEAVAHCDAALRARPEFAQAHNNLGSLLAALGRSQEAVGPL